jgi:hypothetical protein
MAPRTGRVEERHLTQGDHDPRGHEARLPPAPSTAPCRHEVDLSDGATPPPVDRLNFDAFVHGRHGEREDASPTDRSASPGGVNLPREAR